MTNSVSLEYLKMFYIVALEGNITKASEKLFVSQSAVTQKIKKMEQSIGYDLFFRTTKGVELTDCGKELYSRLKPVFCSLESVDVFFEDLNNFKMGELKICCGTNLAKKVLLEPICKFNQKYPSVKITQFDYSFSQAIEMISSAKIDIFLSQKEEKTMQNFDFLPIFTQNYVFVCSKDYYKNIYSKNNVCTYIVQNEVSKNRIVFDEYMANNKMTKDIKIEVVGYNMMIELCKKNLGIIMVPLYLVEDEIRSGELVDLKYKNLPSACYGAYINKYINNKLAGEFLKLFKSK